MKKGYDTKNRHNRLSRKSQRNNEADRWEVEMNNRVKLKKNMFAILIFFSVFYVGHVNATVLNCTLSQQSNYIDDAGQEYPRNLFMMYDTTPTVQTCLEACQKYSSVNIEPNQDSFSSIGWTCFYKQKEIARKKLK